MAKEWKDYSTKEKKTFKIVLGVIGGLFILMLAIAVFSSGGDSSSTEDTSTTFSGSINRTEVVDPATLRVYFEVENTGEHPGKPSCEINASNDSGTYEGYDTFTSSEDVQSNETVSSKGDLVITNEGSRFVTNTTIECK